MTSQIKKAYNNNNNNDNKKTFFEHNRDLLFGTYRARELFNIASAVLEAQNYLIYNQNSNVRV